MLLPSEDMATLLSNGDEDATTMLLSNGDEDSMTTVPISSMGPMQLGTLLALDGSDENEDEDEDSTDGYDSDIDDATVVSALYDYGHDGFNLMQHKPDEVNGWEYFAYLMGHCTDEQIACITATGAPSEDQTIEDGMIEHECSEALSNSNFIEILDDFGMDGYALLSAKPEGVTYAEYESYLINKCDATDTAQIIETHAAPDAHTSDKSEEAFAVAVILIDAGVDYDVDTVLSVLPDGNVGAATAREFAAMSAEGRAAIMEDAE